jgi:hypothetical protein
LLKTKDLGIFRRLRQQFVRRVFGTGCREGVYGGWLSKVLDLVVKTNMSELSKVTSNLPPDQQTIQAKCFHSMGTFIEFKKEEIEQSIPDRFEQQVGKYSHHIAVKTNGEER